MKTKLILILAGAVLMVACTSSNSSVSGDQTPFSTEVPAENPTVAQAPDSPTDVTMPVHIVAIVDYASGIATLETLGWCEKIPNANEQFPCIEHEVGHLTQGGKSTYFERTWTPGKYVDDAKLVSTLNPEEPSKFWNQDSTAWDRQAKLLSSTKAMIVNMKFDLNDYVQYLESEKTVMLSRCLEAPRRADLNNMPVSAQGYVAISAPAMSAMTLRSGHISESLEFNVDTNEIVFIAASSKVNPVANYGDLLLLAPEVLSSLYEINLSAHNDTVEFLFQALRPRDDIDLQRFSFACSAAYDHFHASNKSCFSDGILPLSDPNNNFDSKASALVPQILKDFEKPGSDEPKLRDERTLNLSKPYWSRLPPTCSIYL